MSIHPLQQTTAHYACSRHGVWPGRRLLSMLFGPVNIAKEKR
jgi:hypothetical protein